MKEELIKKIDLNEERQQRKNKMFEYEINNLKRYVVEGA